MRNVAKHTSTTIHILFKFQSFGGCCPLIQKWITTQKRIEKKNAEGAPKGRKKLQSYLQGSHHRMTVDATTKDLTSAGCTLRPTRPLPKKTGLHSSTAGGVTFSRVRLKVQMKFNTSVISQQIRNALSKASTKLSKPEGCKLQIILPPTRTPTHPFEGRHSRRLHFNHHYKHPC